MHWTFIISTLTIFIVLPFTIAYNKTITSGTSVDVLGLHAKAPEHLVFGSNKADGWKTIPTG